MESGLKLVIVGVGGQGVLFATRVLSETALELGLDVIGAETHGMSQRGGSVVSHVKIDVPGSPVVRRGTADLLLALDADESYKALPFLRRGGIGFVSTGRHEYPTAEIAAYLATHDVELYAADADAVAREAGSATLANVALIGFALAHPAIPFPYSFVETTIAKMSNGRFHAANLDALARGYAIGRHRFATTAASL